MKQLFHHLLQLAGTLAYSEMHKPKECNWNSSPADIMPPFLKPVTAIYLARGLLSLTAQKLPLPVHITQENHNQIQFEQFINCNQIYHQLKIERKNPRINFLLKSNYKTKKNVTDLARVAAITNSKPEE